MVLTILGAPRTKKTSNRIVRVKGRPIVLPSKANVGWTSSAVLQLRAQYRASAGLFGRVLGVSADRKSVRVGRVDAALDCPVNVRALIYRDANRGDLVGYLQAICDALETAGVVEDDKLCVSFDGSRMFVDRHAPRVEIELSDTCP